jgi:exonuclease 3'-5' domain-containing protein 1
MLHQYKPTLHVATRQFNSHNHPSATQMPMEKSRRHTSANMSTQPSITIIDTEQAVQILLDSINNLPTSPPSLYLDLEGVNLGRDGYLSIMQLHVPPKSQVYLIDIHILGRTAFSTPGLSGQTFKSILESASIPKVFFDIRNDSDALFSHYQISVNGIHDLQLMELATRNFSKRYVNGLAKCIERDSAMSAAKKREWRRIKDSTNRLYDPNKGGRYEIFNDRPLLPDIICYCAQDVVVLPELWLRYNGRLTRDWRKKVMDATMDRIVESQSAGYVGQGMHKALGPW